jgi:hypothetical protein
LLLQAVLDGENPLGDFEPTGVKLPAKVAARLESYPGTKAALEARVMLTTLVK